jgi:hypothetical protein
MIPKWDRVVTIDGTALTVSVTGDETTVKDGLELSVTWSSKLQIPTVVKVPVETEGFEEGVQPVVKELPRSLKLVPVGDSSSHWHVYGEVPPVNDVAVNSLADWPLPIVVGETEIVGGVGTGLTVTVTSPEATDSDALSLTWSSKLQTPRVDRTPVETVGREEVSQLK